MPLWLFMDSPVFRPFSSVHPVLFVGKGVDKTRWFAMERSFHSSERFMAFCIPALTDAEGLVPGDAQAYIELGWRRTEPDLGWDEPTGVYRLEAPTGHGLFTSLFLMLGSPKSESKHWVIHAEECVIDSPEALTSFNALCRFLQPRARLWVPEATFLDLPYLEAIDEADDVFGGQMQGYRAYRFKGVAREARGVFRPSSSAHRSTLTKGTPLSTEALVVGAGLAGALVAYELAQQGIRPTVINRYCVPGAGASALYAGLIHPHWQRSDSPLFALTRRGYARTLALLAAFPECFEPTGVIDCATSDAEYQDWLEASEVGAPFHFPERYLALTSRETASRLAGLALARGGWYFPQAGLVHCGAWVRALLAASKARVLTGMAVTIEPGDLARWVAVSETGVSLCEADRVFVCAAMESASSVGLCPTQLGLSPLKGRISMLPAGSLTAKMPVTGQGYVMKTTGFEAVGATYESERESWSASRAHAHNLQAFEVLFQAEASERRLVHSPWCGFYEGTRAVPEDRLPLMGAFFTGETLRAQHFKAAPELKAIARDEGLWICAGLGSRGLTWGALLAQEVVAMALGLPGTLPGNLVQALDPARFAFNDQGQCRE